MRYFILLLFLFLNLISFAQGEKIITSPKIRTVITEADACFSQGNKNCELLYHKAILLGRQSKEKYMDFLYYKLSQYHFNNYQQDSSLVYIDLGLKSSTNFESEASLLNLKAGIFYNRGDIDAALEIFILLADKLKEKQDWQKLAYTYTNIGNLFDSQENDQKSLEYLIKSFDILQKIKDTTYIATTVGNIAEGYFSIKKYDQAAKWSHKALKIKDYSRDYRGKIIAYNTLSKIYLKTYPDSSLIYSKKAVALSQAKNERLMLGNSYVAYAEALMERKKFPEAQEAIEKAVEIHREIDFQPGLADNLFIAGIISRENKMYEKAASFLYESKKLSDSLKSKQRIKTINELNTKYETEQKEKLLAEQKLTIEREQNQKRLILIVGVISVLTVLSILFLYRKNQKIKQEKTIQEKENEVLSAFINGEERERSRISQELHDGVASMIGVAKMNMETLPHLPEEKQKDQILKVVQILENTHADIRHIAHNLLPITLEKEGLIKATEQFAKEISETGILKIIVTNDSKEELTLSIQKQLMLFRMIQELINNTIKHSQAQIATIHFSQTNNTLLIEISDDGVGFIGEITKESQGLYSIQQRMSSILGRFSFQQGEDNKGVKAILELTKLH